MSANATDTAVAMNFMAGSPVAAAWPDCGKLASRHIRAERDRSRAMQKYCRQPPSSDGIMDADMSDPASSVRPWGRAARELFMCRNIKTLFNFEPPATHAEIHASALQFVRKLSGFNSPSQANAEAFNRAVSEVADSARRLLASLQTNAPARDREIEAEKARERSRARFG